VPFTLHHSSSLTQIISTSDAKLDVAIKTPCSSFLLLADSNLFQEKVIKNEETIILERSVFILKARKKRPQLSLVDIQGTPTSSSGNGSKTITRLGNKATSKPATCNLQAGVKTRAKEVTKK
jgi:hypothetical protein